MSYLNADAARARAYFPRGLFQPEGSFRFSLDALLLAAYAARLRPDWRRLADLGCGCGPVALGVLLLAERPQGREVLGLDLREELLEAARLNAARLGFGWVFRAARADFADYAPGNLTGSFDLVVANPPYRLPGEGRQPPSEARRAALFGGPETLAAFLRAGRSLLAPGGAFCLVFPFRRLDELTERLAAEGLAAFDVLPVRAREDAEPGLVLLSARADEDKNKGLAVKMQKPLILYQSASSAGGWSLTSAALAFCRFLSCNTQG